MEIIYESLGVPSPSESVESLRDDGRKYRAFACTFFPTDRFEGELIIDDLKRDKLLRYFIVGHEYAGTTNKYHLQMYLYHKNKVSFAGMKKRYPRFHIEPARSGPEKNIEYCSKEGDFVEHGDKPASGAKKGGEANAENWLATKEAAKEGRLEDIDPQHYICYYRTLKAISVDHMKKLDNMESVCGVWFYGKSGTGKSHAAREEYPEFYYKLPNKWWDGYQKEENVLIDDFGKVHNVLGYHLKIWADKYPFLAEVKGSSIMIRPKKIVVTSNYHPREIWEDEATLEPILRRFKVTHFVNPFERLFTGHNETEREAYVSL